MSEFEKQPAGETLEQTRHNYTIKAQMEESDDTSYAGIMIKPAQQGKANGSGQKKRQSLSDMLMINDIMQSLNALENMMVAKYGEDFDLHLAAEFLDNETYKRLASIQDIDERREAVAQAIHEGIENGSIDSANVDAINPDFGDWVDARVELAEKSQPDENLANKADIEQDSTLEQSAIAAFGPLPPSV